MLEKGYVCLLVLARIFVEHAPSSMLYSLGVMAPMHSMEQPFMDQALKLTMGKRNRRRNRRRGIEGEAHNGQEE